MMQEENLKDSVISFLNSKDETNKFLQNYHSSAEIDNLLEIINVIEQESQEKMDQVISMSKNPKECFEDPLSQVNTSFEDFKRDFQKFQDSQKTFNGSYDIVQSKLFPHIIIDRNIDLAIELYNELKIGLEEMNSFESKFSKPTFDQKDFEEAVNYQLDKFLVCYDYFQQTSNSDAFKIFNQKIEEWESKIVHHFQMEVDSFNNYIIFFNKFDQEKYANAKKIKEDILEKIYRRHFAILRQFENDIKFITNSKTKSEQFINEFFKSLSEVLSSFQQKFTEVPDSYSKGVIQIFKSVISNVLKFIDNQLQSNNQLVFSFSGFYAIYEAQVNIIQKKPKKDELNVTILEKANDIFRPIRERCFNELIKKWNKELKDMINQPFANYKDHPNRIFKNTEKYIATYKAQAKSKQIPINDDDIVSTSIYSKYQGKYIIEEVFNVIHKFETEYDAKISSLKKQDDPRYTELLIQNSNLIIQNINEINTTNLDHTRSTILIILNTYDALAKIVSFFKSQRYGSETKLLPLLKLERCQHSYLDAFASIDDFDKSSIDQFFDHIKKLLITDSLKTYFTALFTEHSIYLISVFLISKNKTKVELLSKIYEYSINILDHSTSIKKLYNKATDFYRDPQNSTMNELINSITNNTIRQILEPNLLRIINEKNK